MVMQKTILIAEDYDDTRSFMKFMLEAFGYKVLEAANGQEA
jgi:CheY-like chemotaxis protein